MEHAEPDSHFPDTRWSLVRQVRTPADEGAQHTALAALCTAYWYPLYAFARRSGRRDEDAKDATQGFFAHVVQTNLFAAADPRLGKLRTFLLAGFQHFLADTDKRSRAEKRGGGCAFLPLEAGLAESRYAHEPADPRTPEKLFDWLWAQAILQAAHEALTARETRRGRGALFEVFKPFLDDRSGGGLGLAQAGRGFDLSEAAAQKVVERLREKFRTAVREQIAATLRTPTEAQVHAEMAALLAILRG